MAAIKALKSKCVIQALDSGSNGRAGISPVAVAGFSSAKAGKIYPFLVITSPNQTVLYEVLSNKDLYSKKALKGAQDSSIKKLKENPLGLPKADESAFFYLKSKVGSYQGLYVGDVLSETSFMAARKKGGKVSKYSTDNFTVGAKNYIKHLYSMQAAKKKAELDSKIKALMPTLEVETWTNTKGKPLQGTFVSLSNGEITLSIPRKTKPVTFSIDLLDAASQKRANEIAAQVADAKKKVESMKAEAK